jgi:hypothetical protein
MLAFAVVVGVQYREERRQKREERMAWPRETRRGARQQMRMDD